MKMRKNRIDPELIKPLELREDAIGCELNTDDLPAARKTWKAYFETIKKGFPDIEGVIVDRKKVPGPPNGPDVCVRIYRPEGPLGTLPALLWIHGGGYIFGSAEQDELQSKRFAKALKCVVVSVDYRLAPETPFPGPLEDCYAALKWLYDNCLALDVDQSRIVIGGASAGGGLAAGLALLARDRAEISVIFQLLIFPMIDDKNVSPPSEKNHDTFIWSRRNNLIGWRSYLGQEPGGNDVSPYAAAYRAKNLSGLPPAYIMVGGLDLFLNESIVYSQRLMTSGVPVELHVYPGAYHGFYGNAPAAEVSRRFVAECDAVLKRAFFNNPQSSPLNSRSLI